MEKTPFLNPADFLEDETFLISFNIARICQRICDVQTRILKKYDLTPRQSLVLAYLRNHADEKVTQKVLEEKMHLSNPTVTVIVQSMIGKGLIAKEKDTEDRRKYILHMTEKGKVAFNNGRGESRAVDELAYDGLSREDIDYLKSIMRRIMNNLVEDEK